MKTKIQIIALTIGICMGGVVEAKTIRAGDISPEIWSNLMAGSDPTIIEFRKKDQIPINISVEGDLLEATQPGTSYLMVKIDFWLKFQKNESGVNLEMSLDGTNYKPIKELVKGKFSMIPGFDPGSGFANAINLIFEAYLKN